MYYFSHREGIANSQCNESMKSCLSGCKTWMFFTKPLSTVIASAVSGFWPIQDMTNLALE
jgi:hypothetical protein